MSPRKQLLNQHHPSSPFNSIASKSTQTLPHMSTTSLPLEADHASISSSNWEAMPEGSKQRRFPKLPKKLRKLMHQLLHTSEDDKKGQAPMKWDRFVKLMRGMGFKYNPSMAGSRVRFDPPDSDQESITFHKPHPDPTIQPIKLKEYSKQLQDTYGWTGEDFV